MKKVCLLPTILFSITLLSSCSSLEQISIDYLQPAEYTFPKEVKSIAIVNSTSKKVESESNRTKKQKMSSYYSMNYEAEKINGNANIAAEALSQEIARQNYFDTIVIYKPMPQTGKDSLYAPKPLTKADAQELIDNLNVDCLITLDSLQLESNQTITYLPEWDCYHGLTKIKVHPTFSMYLPGDIPYTQTTCDSTSIEDFYYTIREAEEYMFNEKEIIRVDCMPLGFSLFKYS